MQRNSLKKDRQNFATHLSKKHVRLAVTIPYSEAGILLFRIFFAGILCISSSDLVASNLGLIRATSAITAAFTEARVSPAGCVSASPSPASWELAMVSAICSTRQVSTRSWTLNSKFIPIGSRKLANCESCDIVLRSETDIVRDFRVD